MHKIKKLFILPLIFVLVLSVITLWPSAQESIPQGPIDSTDKNHGVTQIMQAGVQDKNFATAIYDSFVDANYFGDETKDVRQILSEYNGNIDASDRGIESIYGIEWLKNTAAINLSNSSNNDVPKLRNKISDLTPLSIRYISKVASISEGEAEDWYRFDYEDNIEIDISGNPISYYEQCAGHIILQIKENNVPKFEGYHLTAIKEESKEDWSTSLTLETPEIYENDKRVIFSKESSKILDGGTTINDDIIFDLDALDSNQLKIDNIKNSGKISIILGIPKEFAIDSYKYTSFGGGSGGTTGVDSVSYAYGTIIDTQIYMPVYKEKELDSKIRITKYATSENSGRVVTGAKYRLFYDNGDQNYDNDVEVGETEYITDENGEFYIDETLDFKKYYLKEVEAPEGFLINENPILLDLTGADVSITGGDTDLDVNSGNIAVDPNAIYINSYSNDVNVQISAEEKFQLKSVNITYWDRESHSIKTIKKEDISTVEEASKWATDWINTNKGEGEALGIIDGKVTVDVEFEYQDELKTTDDRPTTDVEFNKAKRDIDEDGNLNITPLPGAVFKLECMHEHTDACLDETGGYTNCTDPHADLGNYVTDTGCNWTSEATSDSEGKVKFSKLNSGKYRMREIQTPDGYLPTDTVWILEVDAANHNYTITVDSEDGNSETTGDFETGYTIINETYNIKVKKVDAQTNEPLKGAKFGLYKLDEDGNWSKEPIQVDITRDNGLAIFEKLDEGQYKIKELQAPLGYELITEEIEFKLPFEYISSNEDGVETEISSDAKTITFTVSNKNGINLPRTGADITGRVAAIGIVIMGISAILLKRQVRKKS